MKRAIGFSFLLLTATSYAGPYGDLWRAIKDAPRQSISQAISRSAIPDDQKQALQEQWVNLDGVKQTIHAMAELEQIPEPTGSREAAAKIKASPLYVDASAKKESNWLARAMQNLADRFRWQARDNEGTTGSGKQADLFAGAGLTYVIWFLLFGTTVVLLFLAVRQFSWKKSLTRKAQALLSDDEPERSLDEWLALSQKLESEGRYREAVRCLYVACLLKLDQHGVARFERSQTNWEHLVRIERSSSLPSGLDLRPATREFDRIWYGMIVQGISDVKLFRSIYQEVTAKLGVARA